jgi:serine/threonine-protein kinase SRPK3
MEKYEFSEKDANEMTEFLIPILDFVPEKRPTAAQCLLHPWINASSNVLEQSGQNQALESLNSEKKKREKDEREAMEIGLGNIAINVESKGVKDPTSSSVKLSQATTSSSSR